MKYNPTITILDITEHKLVPEVQYLITKYHENGKTEERGVASVGEEVEVDVGLPSKTLTEKNIGEFCAIKGVTLQKTSRPTLLPHYPFVICDVRVEKGKKEIRVYDNASNIYVVDEENIILNLDDKENNDTE